MTDINRDDVKVTTEKNARINRRTILKTGVAVAPLAITLHGGVAFAAVNSAGRCVEEIQSNWVGKVPVLNADGSPTGDYTDFDPNGTTGYIINNQNQTHWEYLESQGEVVQSCYASFFGPGGPGNIN